MKSIGLILATIALIGLFRFSFGSHLITLNIPNDFHGPIAIIERENGVEPIGFWMWKEYTVPDDGVLTLKEIEPFFDWHTFTIKREDGRRVHEIRKNTENRDGFWRMGTHWKMNMDSNTTQKEKDENAVMPIWIGNVDDIDSKSIEDYVERIRTER